MSSSTTPWKLSESKNEEPPWFPVHDTSFARQGSGLITPWINKVTFMFLQNTSNESYKSQEYPILPSIHKQIPPMLGSSTLDSTANSYSSILSLYNVKLSLHWFVKKYGIKFRQSIKDLLYSTHFQDLLPDLDNECDIVNTLHKASLKLLVNLLLLLMNKLLLLPPLVLFAIFIPIIKRFYISFFYE